MKTPFAFCILIAATSSVAGQLLVQEKSSIVFFSEATLEDITATNTKARAIFDPAKGEVAFEVPIKDFVFEKDLMKQHFNEKYLETEKYPKATFAGKLNGYNSSSTGEQAVLAEGKFTIHGVVQTVKIPGIIIQNSPNTVVMKAKFMIKLEDYKIKIPSIVFQKIAEEVEVTVEFTLKAK